MCPSTIPQILVVVKSPSFKVVMINYNSIISIHHEVLDCFCVVLFTTEKSLVIISQMLSLLEDLKLTKLP